jgi:hypothetical protein
LAGTTVLETAVALALAHFLADFVLQSDAMVRTKTRPTTLLRHVAVVTGITWATLGLAPVPWLLLLIAVSHFAIDWLKQRYKSPGFAPFALDQAAHLTVIAIGAVLFPGANAAGLWGLPAPTSLAEVLPRLPQAMALAAGVIVTIWAGGYAVKELMHGLTPPDPASLPQGGRLIGRLERAMILMLVLMNETDAIGFLIAAKSLLRFGELTRDADRRVSEYVIIGTLASFAWGLVWAFATAVVLRALAP